MGVRTAHQSFGYGHDAMAVHQGVVIDDPQ
jgi:hypothetical protein